MSVSDPYRAIPGGRPADDIPAVPTFEAEPGPICRHCGMFAPKAMDTCACCGGDLRALRIAAPKHTELWVLVRASFRCRACDFSSPLDGVELDERVHCAQCGSLQRLEVGGWDAIASAAHDVADLGWPAPEGRMPAAQIYIGDLNPHAKADYAQFTAVPNIPQGSGAVLEASVTPGFPTCSACHAAPLQISVTPERCSTRCPACHASASYGVSKLRAFGEAFAILAPAERDDRPHVRLEQNVAGSPAALLCPRCGAPLVVKEDDNVQCTHCECECYVPVRARRPRHSASGTARVAEPFYVAFHGRSSLRAQLEISEQGKLVPGFVDKAAARGPQLLLTLAATGVALALSFAVLEAAGLIDLL